MSLSFDAVGGGNSPITGGVRQVVGYLQVNGTNIPVISAEAEQKATRSAGHFTATLALDALPDGVDEDFFVNTTPIQAAVAVSTQAGGDPTVLVSGDILEAVFDLEDRLLHVNGNDNSQNLHAIKSSEKFVNQKPSDIVTTIAGRAGLTPQIDPSSLLAGKFMQIDFAKMTQDQSLASILHKLAEFEGARWFVKDKTLYFQKTNSSSNSYTINYTPPIAGQPASGNFLTLRIERKVPLSGTLTSTVSGWHTRMKKVISSTKTMAGQGASPTYNYKSVLPNVEQDHADQHATNLLSDQARHEITVHVEVVGDPTIDFASKLTLSGTKFDQDYDIDSIDHRIAERGYTMMITARSAAAGRSVS